jgi:hypothetical protein
MLSLIASVLIVIHSLDGVGRTTYAPLVQGHTSSRSGGMNTMHKMVSIKGNMTSHEIMDILRLVKDINDRRNNAQFTVIVLDDTATMDVAETRMLELFPDGVHLEMDTSEDGEDEEWTWVGRK